MTVRTWLLLVVCCSSCLVFAQSNQCCKQARNTSSHLPRNAVIPDKGTAARVAEAILLPIYGKDEVAIQKPFRVELKRGVWFVRGRLPQGAGGNLVVELSKQSGCVLNVDGTE